MILFYAAQDNQVVQTLERQMAAFQVARCRAFSTMERRLRKPNHGMEIVLMVVEDLKEMGGIEEIGGLIRDLRLVLVLPGRDAALVSQAHKLAPRFIAYADQGTEQVGAVMEKMTRDCRGRSAMPTLALAEQ